MDELNELLDAYRDELVAVVKKYRDVPLPVAVGMLESMKLYVYGYAVHGVDTLHLFTSEDAES